MSAEPTILHADLDAFFAAVEQRDDPALRGRPVIVGGGVVLAASYEARARGVRSAMGGAEARRRCPQAVVVPARWSAYSEASRAVFDVFDRTAPVVERLSIDEAFLDVRGLGEIAGAPAEVAAALRRAVREDVGLPITVGVARTRVLAKVASGVAKPDGLLVVPPGGERAFLDPLAVECLWGVGPATARRLHALGIARVGQLARLGEATLVTLLGRSAGRQVHALAHGGDPRPVAARARPALGGVAVRARPRRRARPRPSTPSSSGSWTGSRAGCAPAVAPAGPSSCGCASTTSRARPGRTRCPPRRRPPGPSSPRRGRCWPPRGRRSTGAG